MFCHIVYAVNQIWYPGRAIIDCLRHQIVLASYTKWENSQHLKLKKSHLQIESHNMLCTIGCNISVLNTIYYHSG